MKKNKFLQFIEEYGLIVIIILAFGFRLIFFTTVQPWNEKVANQPVIESDALEYNQLALSIISDKSFKNFNSFRTPGYPLFVALLYSISSSSVQFVLLVQIFLSLASVFLIYKTAVLFFQPKIALLSAFLFAFDTTQAAYTVSLLTETLFAFLFLLSVYCFCNYVKDKNILSLCISALILGMATLVRPILIFFPAVAVLVILIERNMKTTRKLVRALYFVLVFFITVFPWLLHNYSKYGEAKLSSISGLNLLYYNAAYTEASKTGKDVDEVRKEFNITAAELGADTIDIYSFKNSSIFSSIAKQYIKSNLLLYAKQHLKGTINMFTGFGVQKLAMTLNLNTESDHSDCIGGSGIFNRITNFIKGKPVGILLIYLLLGLYLWINYLFSVYGMFVLWKDRGMIMILFILIILYFAGLTGVVGYPRYRIPLMPFINILCAAGIFAFYEKYLSQYLSKSN
ncbi:MAG: glycosyltransferase family 39 protein [Spirochaetes bacterium]|nr:glycosyltransferase family 39 protein [Spirochaetota bacterium]